MEFYGIFMDIYGYLRFAMRYHKLIPLMLKHYDREEIISHLVQSPVPNSRGPPRAQGKPVGLVLAREHQTRKPGFFSWKYGGFLQAFL